MRLRSISVLAAALTLGLAAPAAAKTEARLPLGAQFDGLAVAPGGHVWVTGEGRRTGRWGPVVGGRPQWQEDGTLPAFEGLLSARSDGGAWLLADRQTVMRLDPDGSATPFGAVTVPFSEDQWPHVLASTASDDSLVLAGALGGFLRIASDGQATPFGVALPAAPRDERDCNYVDMAGAPGGAFVLSDYRCWRLLAVAPSGAADAVDLRPERGWRYPGSVLVDRDGTLWFTALTLRGVHVRSVIGHVRRDGTIREFPAPNVVIAPAGFTRAPDGAIWARLANDCALYRVRGNRIDRFPAPFPVRDVQFAADGSLWLRGHTRLAHLRVADLRRPRRCDTTPPRFRFPNALGPTRLSVRRLRRSGLRVRATEAATLRGDIVIGDQRFYVNEIIRRPGGVATVLVPDALLDRGGELWMNAELRDRNGNGLVWGSSFALRR